MIMSDLADGIAKAYIEDNKEELKKLSIDERFIKSSIYLIYSRLVLPLDMLFDFEFSNNIGNIFIKDKRKKEIIAKHFKKFIDGCADLMWWQDEEDIIEWNVQKIKEAYDNFVNNEEFEISKLVILVLEITKPIYKTDVTTIEDIKKEINE